MAAAINPPTTSTMLNQAELYVLEKLSMPKDMPIMAMTNNRKPLKSNFCTVGSVTLGMALKVTSTPNSPIGILIRKIQCHVATSTNQPPKVGPISGPTKPARLMRLMADKNWLRGMTFSIAKRPTGSNKAPPMP